MQWFPSLHQRLATSPLSVNALSKEGIPPIALAFNYNSWAQVQMLVDLGALERPEGAQPFIVAQRLLNYVGSRSFLESKESGLEWRWMDWLLTPELMARRSADGTSLGEAVLSPRIGKALPQLQRLHEAGMHWMAPIRTIKGEGVPGMETVLDLYEAVIAQRNGQAERDFLAAVRLDVTVGQAMGESPRAERVRVRL